MSTMDKKMMKHLLKILTSGHKAFTNEVRKELMDYASTILDKEK